MPILIISDPETGESRKVEVEDSRMSALIGRRIGEVLDGAIANLPGYKLQLTGGCDKDGIPMRPDIHGGVKGRFILSGGVGYKPRNPGERRKKMVRGNTVTSETKYLNFKIVSRPPSRPKP
jgi:small subunit ribosomal protein S6e